MPPENRRRRNRTPVDPTAGMNPAEKAAFLEHKRLETPLAESGLPVRIVNALEDNGILLVKELIIHDREHFLKIRNFGEKTLREIIAAVARLGLKVPPNWLKPKPKIKKPRSAPVDPGFLSFG